MAPAAPARTPILHLRHEARPGCHVSGLVAIAEDPRAGCLSARLVAARIAEQEPPRSQALIGGLAAFGVPAAIGVPSVLLYRVLTCWLPVFAGWPVMRWLTNHELI